MERYGARHRYRPSRPRPTNFRVPRGENDEILIATAARLRLTPFRCPRNSSLRNANDLIDDMNASILKLIYDE